MADIECPNCKKYLDTNDPESLGMGTLPRGIEGKGPRSVPCGLSLKTLALAIILCMTCLPAIGFAQLFDTGVYTQGSDRGGYEASGQVGMGDYNWYMNSYPDPTNPLKRFGPSPCIVDSPDSAWILPSNGPAQWIGPVSANGNGATNCPAGTYDYATDFTIPAGVDLNSVVLSGDFAAAAASKGVYLNGWAVDGAPVARSSVLIPFSVEGKRPGKGFQIGENHLEFLVNNGGGPTGLLLAQTSLNYQEFINRDTYDVSSFDVSGTVGQTLSSAVPTSNPAFNFSAQGVPPGLSINSAGIISGTPDLSGYYPVQVEANDGSGPAYFQESDILNIQIDGTDTSVCTVSLAGSNFIADGATGSIGIELTRSGDISGTCCVLLATGPPTDSPFEYTEFPTRSGNLYADTGGSIFSNAYAATPGQYYQSIYSLVTFNPGVQLLVVPISLSPYNSIPGARQEFSVNLTPVSNSVSAGLITSANISIIDDSLSLQISGVQDVQSVVNSDLSLPFSATLLVENSSISPTGPAQIELVAVPGYQNAALASPPTLPAEMPLGTYPVSNTLPPDSMTPVLVSGTVPIPPDSDLSNIYWWVKAIVEQQDDGIWAPTPASYWVLDGPRATYTVPMFEQGGGTETNTALGAAPSLGAFLSQTLASLQITGPARVDEHSTATFSANGALSGGSVVSGLSAAWTASKFHISSSGLLTTGTVAADTEITVTATVTVAGMKKTASREVLVLVPKLPAVSVTAIAPFALTTTGTNPGIFTVARTGGDPNVAVPVNFSVAGAAQSGVNYVALSGTTVTIPPRATSAMVSINPVQTMQFVAPASVNLTLMPGPGYVITTPTTARVTIGSVGLAFLGPAASVSDTSGTATLTVQLTPGSLTNQPVTVSYATSDGALGNSPAVSGVDYTGTSGTLTFGAGVTEQTIPISLLDNPFANGPRAFTVTLSNPGDGAALGAPSSCAVNISENPAGSFLPLQGYYVGLAAGGTSSYSQLQLSKHGGITGSLVYQGTRYTLAGNLDQYGYKAFSFNRAKMLPLVVEIQAGSPLNGTVLEQIDDGDNILPVVTANKVIPGSESTYTVILPRNTALSSEQSYPQGDGYAVMKVSPNGTVRIVGVLGDGTHFSLGSGITQAGLPFYCVDTSSGVVGGILNIVSQLGSDLSGTLSWSKSSEPVGTSHGNYAGGFQGTIAAIGSVYAPPPRKTLLLNFGNLTASGSTTGMLAIGSSVLGPLNSTVVLSPSDAVAFTPPQPGFGLKLARSTGYFSGTFKAPGTTMLTPFNGVLFLKQNIAQGLFTDQHLTGYVELGPP